MKSSVPATTMASDVQRQLIRVITTTDSGHGWPIYPNLARDILPTGPNQLWVGDITYVALPTRFIYVAIILDAWSRLVVGYAIGRSIDARLTVAALKMAIAHRRPPARTTATTAERPRAPGATE